MGLAETIAEDLTAAMKSKGEGRELLVSVLRMMKSSIKNAEIAQRGSGKELTDEDIVGVLSGMAKQRSESAEQYLAAGRSDRAEEEQAEIEIIRRYLPRQLSPEELDAIVRESAREAGVADVKDIGRLMKVLMPKVKGKADGRLVSQLAREVLEKGV
jgi:uncharacterized protein YqeY